MSVISYIIESLVCSGLFLMLYRRVLARKVGFVLCRIYLTVTMLLSVTIPVMEVPVYTSYSVAEAGVWNVFRFDDFDIPADEATAESVVSQEADVNETAMTDAVPVEPAVSLRTAFAILYVLLTLMSLSLLAYNGINIHRLRTRSHLTYGEGYILAEHEDIKTPFSFIRTIFMGFNYEPQERSQIIVHEASHVRHRHSYERLFMSVLRSVFWFNPFFRMAEKDLEEVQEWEADKDVLDEGWDLKTYRTTIFKQLFGYNPDITCGLNHSFTKQRFIMMTQTHSGKGAWIRLAATLPVIAAAFFAFGCGTRRADTEKVSSDLTNGTETSYIDMCPPCYAAAGNSFVAGGAGQSNSGIDYVLNEGEPVYAAADGEISSVVRDDDNGLMLVLKHADGYETRYAHLSKVEIVASDLTMESEKLKVGKFCGFSTEGDHSGDIITGRVFKGQRIGYAGSTGRAVGPHLHFELRKNGIAIDPAPHFTSEKPVKAPFMIMVWEGTGNTRSGEDYHIFCNGKAVKKDEIGQLVNDYFEGEPMHMAVVHISAEKNVPVGVITDIKEQLRSANALRVRYEADDSSIEKRLPPVAQSSEPSYYPKLLSVEDWVKDVSLRNLISIRINNNDKILMGTEMSLKAGVQNIFNVSDFDAEMLKKIIVNAEGKATLPEYEMLDIIMPDGSARQFRVSKGAIMFQSGSGTSYGGYTKAMERITSAYKELREDVSYEVFGKPLSELEDDELRVVCHAVPMRVSEQ